MGTPKRMTDEQFDRLMGEIKIARESIVKATGGKRSVSGRIDCPICQKAKLAYAVANNGHIHAQCETGDCVQWVE